MTMQETKEELHIARMKRRKKQQDRVYVVLAIVVFVLMILSFLTAKAVGAQENITIGDRFPMSGRICDSFEQIESIILANMENGWEAGEEIYGRYNGIINEKGELVCGKVMPNTPVVLLESLGKYRITMYDGVKKDIWAVKIGLLQNGDAYYTFFTIPVFEAEEIGEEM